MTRENSRGEENLGPAFILSERGLADRWLLSCRTLQRWRAEGFGPAYVLIGGSIRYRMADVLDYEARHTIGGRGRK